MKVLELYSGIGGMHLALKESQIPGEIIASIDINNTANTIYKHNFATTKLLNKNIQSLQPDFINSLGVDTILMSPPCQPFTRNGLGKDIKDPRTESFLHLLKVLPHLNIKNILMENVKGFETSEMRDKFVAALEDNSFNYQEFILSPTQFGVPNMRSRYYCLAKKKPERFKFETGDLMESIPNSSSIQPHDLSKIIQDSVPDSFLLPDKILQKYTFLLDVRFNDSNHTCCFTKAYHRFAEGTGSVYTNLSKAKFDEICAEVNNLDKDNPEYLKKLKSLNLRYFTDREICRLMSFPEDFMFPDSVSLKQRYMVLGNSVNIKVVSELIKLLNT